MRNLTIKRAKSFVGCLVSMKIYIEDPASNELTINNTPCRKIGELKNGEEKTFQIDERAAKIFAIADKLSKEFCNEYYQLPDGQEDIVLSGKNKFNPASGNAFRFDNNDSPAVAGNRKRGTRIGLVVLFAAAVLGLVLGFGVTKLMLNKAPEAKTFSSHGMTITLTDEFEVLDKEGFTASFDSKKAGVFALKEEFSLFEGFGDNTVEEYAEMVIWVNGLDSVEVRTDNGLTGFEYDYTHPEIDATLHWFSYVYKTNDAFWLVQFSMLDEDVEAYRPQVIEWAKSVTFSD